MDVYHAGAAPRYLRNLPVARQRVEWVLCGLPFVCCVGRSVPGARQFHWHPFFPDAAVLNAIRYPLCVPGTLSPEPATYRGISSNCSIPTRAPSVNRSAPGKKNTVISSNFLTPPRAGIANRSSSSTGFLLKEKCSPSVETIGSVPRYIDGLPATVESVSTTPISMRPGRLSP